MTGVPNRFRESYVSAVARMMLQEFDISEPPVDVEKLVEQRNIYVNYHSFDMPSYVVLCRGHYMMFIHLSNYGRNRWSIAHELAHVELGHLSEEIGTLCESNVSDRQAFIMEKEADLFARNLLMPSMWVKRFASETSQSDIVNKTAKRFGVSRQAARIRLSEVGAPVSCFR